MMTTPRSYLCFTLSEYLCFNKNLFRINLLKKYIVIFLVDNFSFKEYFFIEKLERRGAR
jgi:hypothetical protein